MKPAPSSLRTIQQPAAARRLALSSAQALAAHMIGVLGFRPRRHIVVVGLDARRRLIRPPQILASISTLMTSLSGSPVQHIGSELQDQRAVAAVVVGFDDALGTEVSAQACDAVGVVTEQLGHRIGEAEGWLVAVDAVIGPWLQPQPKGQAFGLHPVRITASAPVAAGAAYTSFGTARALAPNQTAPVDVIDRNAALRSARRWIRLRAVSEQSADLAAWQRESMRMWRAALSQCESSTSLSPATLGRLSAGLRDHVVRDAVLLALVHFASDKPHSEAAGSIDVAQLLQRVVFSAIAPSPNDARLRASQMLITAVVAHSKRDNRAAGVTLLAWLAWWNGDSVESATRVCDALTEEPSYVLAQLIGQLIATGFSPGWIRRAMDSAGETDSDPY